LDIVTHALMGTALASGAFAGHPLEATTFVLGGLLPDMDALSRVLGRAAFLEVHQTLSHSIPLQWLAGALAALALHATGSALAHLPLVLAAGATLHSLLDASNTFGVTLAWPLSRRRFALEWVFFVDAGCLLLTAAALAVAGPRLARAEAVPVAVPAGYLAACLLYWSWRARLRRRAAALAPPGTLALVPSALWPRRFYGVAREAPDRVTTFTLDVGARTLHQRQEHEVHDQRWGARLRTLPEYRAIRALSPAYHVTAARAGGDATHLECRDLRTRNFGGEFGRLEVRLGAAGPEEVVFHV
jgi:membrane-bound metal-dependent hydrolase YbcI (DUF457 family)